MEKFILNIRSGSGLVVLRLVFIVGLVLGGVVRVFADPFVTERTIIQLAHSWHAQMQVVSERQDLISFCGDDRQRRTLFELLDEIYYQHNLLETELQASSYPHSQRTVRRILKEIERLKTGYHPDDFAEFFREQCWLRAKTERNAALYNTGFGTHSYGGKVYVQEAVTDWYLRRLSKRISRIKKHVEQFYAQRLVWEHQGERPLQAKGRHGQL